MAQQFFLIFMVIGACSGSTGGGIKIIRVVTLFKVVKTRLIKVNSSIRSRVPVTVDGKIVNKEEINRIVTIVTFWLLLLVAGGAVTAFFSSHGALESFSGMFSAEGNIGPCYISVKEMIALHPAVKLTYIFGMLAGRLEIIPVILIFNKKFFK
jgi:trk system potassium uptake protein TrkH